MSLSFRQERLDKADHAIKGNPHLPFWIFFVFLVFLSHCTFGSVGDSEKEKGILLQNILTLQRNIRATTRLQIQFYGDEVDNRPENWQLRSSGEEYNLTLRNDSILRWQSGTLRVNPQVGPLGFSISASDRGSESSVHEDTVSNFSLKTHTPFTVPLQLPIGDPYGQSYTFVTTSEDQLVQSQTTDVPTGFVHSVTKSIDSPPQGNLALVSLEWQEIFLNLNLERGGTSKVLRIFFRTGQIQIRPKCQVRIFQGKSTPIPISFRYGNLFRDRSDLGQNNALLQRIFSLSGNEVFLSSFQNETLFAGLLRNMQQEDLSWFLTGCNPGTVL